ncbi:hypothetical protein GCM10018771_29130 [Streptomyces cellulosae]|nr:hypothetical protein GCM10018771_29130 [Streptomyces cellulosae]
MRPRSAEAGSANGFMVRRTSLGGGVRRASYAYVCPGRRAPTRAGRLGQGTSPRHSYTRSPAVRGA